MPGLYGLIAYESLQADTALEKLRRMGARLLHQPGSVSESHTQSDLNLYAGWTLDPRQARPSGLAWSANRDVAIIFSGEHFDHGDGSLASLLALYERLGPDSFYRELNGWFSGVLIDVPRREVTVFNDRFGLGRIYYYESRDGFYFATEAKALFSCLPELRELDPQSLGEFVTCGCALQGRSLFKEVRYLPPASAWVRKGLGPIARTSYFDPATWTQQRSLPHDEYLECLKGTLATVTPWYFRGCDRPGVSLTGGVDSRMVLAWASRQPSTVRTYTFGGPYRECHDVRLGRAVAAASGQPHEVIQLGDDFLKAFPALAEQVVYITDGAMDMTGAPDLYVNRLARDISPVRVTGNYGGEVLRHIVAFKPMPVDGSILSDGVSATLAASRVTYANERRVPSLDFVAFKQTPWHHFSRLSLELSQLTLRSPFLDNAIVGLAFRAPSSALSVGFALAVVAGGDARLSGIATDRGVRLGAKETRVDAGQLWHNFTFRAEYAYDYGMPHRLASLDERLSWCHLERLWLGRHKFYHFRYWYRHQLASYVKEILLDPLTLTRPIFNARRLKQIVESHTCGRGNYTLEIHRALTLELMHRHLLDG